MIAAAEVKPDTTACDRKFTTTPARTSPSPSCRAPTNRASVAARVRYSALPGSASRWTASKVSSETIATGPTASARDEPMSAYATIGSVEAIRPATGGIPARRAYAMPCGTSMTATVSPASRSGARSARR